MIFFDPCGAFYPNCIKVVTQRERKSYLKKLNRTYYQKHKIPNDFTKDSKN